eukprot:Colp12_sorted_trinity150504_noHs@27883
MNFPRPQSPGRLGSPSFSGKHINTTSTLGNTSGGGVHSASRNSFGLGSFSSSPSGKSGSRKHGEVIAEQTADIVQAALDAAHLLTDPDSSKAPFETRERTDSSAGRISAPAPPLKTQVRQLSKQFGNAMRQSSALMYRSMRGSKQFHVPRGQSFMSEAEDTLFDTEEDIPMVEIDEMDCLKNASVKILLSFVEFLEDGNVSSFQPED